ncbi:MAG: sensor domain-containing diguanylate cyclase [Clostridium sp.]
MNKMKVEYNKLVQDFENYRKDSEAQMKKLRDENARLDRDVNSLVNIVEISRFININFDNENLISLINDMIIRVLGVNYSTIFIYEDGRFEVKASNVEKDDIVLNTVEERQVRLGEDFRVNYCSGVKYYKGNDNCIRSSMGVAIKASEKRLGYIVVEHILNDYLDENNELLLRAIANQIGVAIENHILYRKLQDNNKLDPLLGIYNRKYFFEKVGKIIEEDKNKMYGIVMIDLDDFKKYNDTYGHQFGDEVLIEISGIISNEVQKENGIFARYGGEELIIFLPNIANKEETLNKIDYIRMQISNTEITIKDITTKITASFGIGISEYEGQPVYDVINKADKILYRVKNNGKNKVYIN